jgi:hypothetical protein
MDIRLIIVLHRMDLIIFSVEEKGRRGEEEDKERAVELLQKWLCSSIN